GTAPDQPTDGRAGRGGLVPGGCRRRLYPPGRAPPAADQTAGGTGDALAVGGGIGATSPSPSWGGWLRRSRSRVGAAWLFTRRALHHPALPTRSLRDHPPHEGEGEVRRLFPQ